MSEQDILGVGSHRAGLMGWQNRSMVGWMKKVSSIFTQILKDGPGPVMVSDTLCPAVLILGT